MSFEMKNFIYLESEKWGQKGKTTIVLNNRDLHEKDSQITVLESGDVTERTQTTNQNGARAAKTAVPRKDTEDVSLCDNALLCFNKLYRQKSWHRMLLLVIAITVHNIPEGLAVGVAFGAVGKSTTATFNSAKTLALGIGIQNFPEGS